MTQRDFQSEGDHQLLDRFHTQQDPAALNELARRYIGLVYSAARRQVRDAHLAEDITQAVFIVLVRNAGSIRRDAILPAWLFSVTRHAVTNALRVQSRRRIHETRKVLMSKDDDDQRPPEVIPEDLRPHLDEAIARLPHAQRDSVILYFFGNRTHKQVGEELGLTEDAARKRIGRALEKMREMLTGRGIGVTSALAIASALSMESAAAASVVPAGLLGSTVNIAMLSHAATTGGGSIAATIAKGVGHIMTLTKIKIAAAVAGALVLTGAGAMPLVSRASSFFAAPVAQHVVTTLIETQAAPATQPGLSVEVNDKTKVEILGLTAYPPAEDTWFAANGEPIDCPRPSLLQNAHTMHAVPAPDTALIIKIDKPESTAVRMEIDGATTVANMQMNEDGETLLMCAFNLNNSPQDFSFRVGISDAPWKTVAASEKPTEATTFDAADIGAVSFQPVEADDDGCKVIAEYAMIRTPNHIIVIDDAGKEYAADNINVQSDGQHATTTCNFKCPADKVKQIHLQTREFNKYVEASNVSLEKGHLTKPVIKAVDAKEGK
ncbi:MAG: sigma-70 family RNA polymerase sigma factor [Anaerolineae bacterium]|nr:sigma-70 family RNA polymerase sigma factor [Phycisphaerae bacterium]